MRPKSKCSRFFLDVIVLECFSGKFGGMWAKILRTAKNFPAPTPMSEALWKVPDCEKLKSTCDNLGAVSSSDVDGKQLYEKSLDCKMLVSSGVTWYYRVLKSFWHSSNCFANNVDRGSYTVFTASCERSFSELKPLISYLRASLINNKSGKVMWYSFDENRKGRNGKSLFWWIHTRLCFDKGTESVLLL